MRTPTGRAADGAAVAEGLGCALLGTVADDAAVRLAAERGDPPGRAARSALAQSAVGRCLRAAAAPSGGGVSAVGRSATSSTSIRSAGGWPGSVDRTRRPTWPTRCGPRVGWSATSLCSRRSRLRRDSVGAGPLEPLLREPGVTDVLVNGPDQVFVDRGTGLEPRRRAVRRRRRGPPAGSAAGRRGRSPARRLLAVRRRPAGRRHPGARRARRRWRRRAPACRSGCRRPGPSRWTTACAGGSLSPAPPRCCAAWSSSRLAFLVSGGTGSGKTTLLAALLGAGVPRSSGS